MPKKGLTEQQARAKIKRALLDQDWTPDTVESVLDAVSQIDGFWTYGTHRVIKDLFEIYQDLEDEHGEAPDGEL